MVLEATEAKHSPQPCGPVPGLPVLAPMAVMTSPAFTLSLSHLKSNVFTHQLGILEPKFAKGVEWEEKIESGEGE